MNDRSGEVRQPQTPAFELPPEPGEQGWESVLESAKEADTSQDQAIKQSTKQQDGQGQVTLVPDSTVLAQADPIVVATATTNAPTKGSEVIVKQWVDRAKKVLIEQRDNPHKQKAELTKVKAGFQEIQYDRKLKIEEAG